MKKIILFFITLSLSLLLFGCGGGDNGGQAGAVFFDPSCDYYLFVNQNDGILTGDVVNAIHSASGTTVKYRAMDFAESFDREIVIGDGDRAVTRAAKQYAASLGLGEDDGIVLVYAQGNSLAVYYNTPHATEMALEYFLDEFVSAEARTVEADGCIYKQVFSISAKKNAEWEARWSVLEGKISDDAIAAMKRLYSLFGTDTYTWLADLYDPELGGFYYSNSARDYIGFLPDVESTRQALTFMIRMGMTDDFDSLADAVPEEIKERMIAFVKSMQDPDDGYFYHTQWGKNINTSRRGRDLTWSVYILTQFGETPDYKTPTERFDSDELASANLASPLGSSVSSAISGLIASTVKPAATNEEAPLDSWESLKAYLDRMDFANDSHAQGQLLSSQCQVIAAAGYGAQVVAYMDALQDPGTGLWESTVSYRSIGGLLKITSAYGTLGGEFKYAEQAMNSCIEMLLSDEPQTSMTCVYNCLNGMSNVMGNLKSHGGKSLVAKVQASLIERAETIISAATQKIAGFRKADGSFSYKLDGTNTHSQGALVSLGGNEGDVNATLLATGVITGIYSVLGLSVVRVYSSDDYEAFMDMLVNMAPIQKEATEPPEPITFDDCDLGEDFPYVIERDELHNDDLSIVKDPRGSGNVISLKTSSGQGDYFHVRLERVSSLAATCFVLESDISFAGITDKSNAEPLQLYMRSARASAKSTYMVTFNIKGDEVKLYDVSYGDSDGFKTDLLTTVSKSDWFKLRIEYYIEDPENVLIKIYVNGELKKISNNFFGPRGSYGENQPTANLDYLFATFYAVKSSDGEMLFDNILTDRTDDKFSAEGYTGEIGGGTKEDFWDSFGVNGTEKMDGTLDFEDFDPEASLTAWSKNPVKTVTNYVSTGLSPYAVKVGDDGNKYIYVDKNDAGAAVLVIKAAEGDADANCYVFEGEFEWTIDAIGSGMQFALSDGTVYTTKTENSKVVCTMSTKGSVFGSHTSGGADGGVKLEQSLLASDIASGQRFTLRIEYYEDAKMAKLFINGKHIITTSDVAKGDKFTHTVIYLTNGFRGDVKIDNLVCDKIVKPFVAE